jgi:hypothetical protein
MASGGEVNRISTESLHPAPLGNLVLDRVSRVARDPGRGRGYDPTMPPAPDPVLAAFAELGTVAAVADRLGFDDPEDARQAIHAALRRSDDEITAADFGYLLGLDSANPELGEQ